MGVGWSLPTSKCMLSTPIVIFLELNSKILAFFDKTLGDFSGFYLRNLSNSKLFLTPNPLPSICIHSHLWILELGFFSRSQTTNKLFHILLTSLRSASHQPQVLTSSSRTVVNNLFNFQTFFSHIWSLPIMVSTPT